MNFNNNISYDSRKVKRGDIFLILFQIQREIILLLKK